MVDLYRLHQRLLAEFAIEGLAALARFRDQEPSTWARLQAWRDRLPRRERKRLADAIEDAMRTMH